MVVFEPGAASLTPLLEQSAGWSDTWDLGKPWMRALGSNPTTCQFFWSASSYPSWRPLQGRQAQGLHIGVRCPAHIRPTADS